MGLHILGTLNHANDAGGVVDAMGGAKHVGGLLQFLPTALLRTTPPEWSWQSSFEQCNTHSDTPNNCSCFLENLGSDQVHATATQHTHHLRRVVCITPDGLPSHTTHPTVVNRWTRSSQGPLPTKARSWASRAVLWLRGHRFRAAATRQDGCARARSLELGDQLEACSCHAFALYMHRPSALTVRPTRTASSSIRSCSAPCLTRAAQHDARIETPVETRRTWRRGATS